ncbi:MAG TPA: ATP-binding protein [Candidatus Thermoplasmatota archaeon]|nr:ATP-binding protein [Candidatus Thermoplasmatota archaeon]
MEDLPRASTEAAAARAAVQAAEPVHVDGRVLMPSDTASAPAIAGSAKGGEAPATIEVARAPGHAGAMEVVVAAEVLRRVNRTRHAVSLVSQVIIRAYEEEALHAEVCRHLVTFGGYLMAWIGVAEEQPTRLVRPIAHAGLEANFLGALKITWSDDLVVRSPTSLAIAEQRPHVARNILKEPRFAVLRKDAQLYGYTATCALPLQFAQFGMGVLTIHATEPDAFNPEEVGLLRELANDLSAGVVGLRERSRRRVIEERLLAVVDATGDAILGTDLEGRITAWNGGAARLFGYANEEVMGRRVDEVLMPPERRSEDQRVRRAVRRGERVPRFETVRLCKEQKIIHTSVTVSPIFSTDGKVVGSTMVEHDVTAARMAEAVQQSARLEETEVARLKGLEAIRKTFMSEASHELNTPLTPLQIHAEALAATELDAEQRSHVVVIERNIQRLTNLVKGMLEASRLETGRFRLEREEIPLGAIVEESLAALRETAAQAGVTLHAGPFEVLLVVADRHRVAQVLHNLVSNAILFTPSGGRIDVSVRSRDGVAMVRVADTGMGLAPEQSARLFQPFSRPHEGSGAPKGTGLGLFISKGIVEQHGGQIWAESDGPGKGSAFCFTLPVVPLQAAASVDPDPASPASPGGQPPAKQSREDRQVRQRPRPATGRRPETPG